MVVRGPYNSRAALVATIAAQQKELDALKLEVVVLNAQLPGGVDPTQLPTK